MKLWPNGLAIAVTKFQGEWPSIQRQTDIDVAGLWQETQEEERAEAEEQARYDAGNIAR